MKGLRARFLLSAALCLAPSAGFGEGTSVFPKHDDRPSLYYQHPKYQCPKLSLDCGRRPGSWIEFKPLDPKYEKNAITLRFGERSESSPSKIEVQIGNALQTALFVAALIVTFAL